MMVYDLLVLLFFLGVIGFILFSLVRNTTSWKPALILLVLGTCLLAMWYPGRYGPAQRLQPGLDLAGGTTLVYDVRVPDDVDSRQVIDDLIDVLRDRVDPQGTRNLVWRQIAGNRIEIQMALATAETGERRQTYIDLRDELLEQNLNQRTINAIVNAPDEPTRQDLIQNAAPDNPELQERLNELAAAQEALAEARGPYQEAQEAYRQALDRLDELEAQDEPDEGELEALEQELSELEGELQERTGEFVQARRQFNRLQEQVLEANIEPAELERILELPRQPQRGQDESPRRRALEQLKAEHPDRANEIETVALAKAAYDQVRGPLDDPEDLIALLRGAGVIEFRIAASQEEGVDVESYREQLAERGPRAGTDRPWRWYPIDDIEEYAETREEQELLEEHGAAWYFQSRRGLVGAEYGGEYYVLLANTPDRAITRDQAGWELRSASRTTDDAGRPAVAFTLNSVGGNLMGNLSRENINRPMAILLDNQVISSPTLQDTIRSRGRITGNFTQQDVDNLVRTLQAGSTLAELAPYPSSIQKTGPQLGQDNLQSGLRAAVWSLIIVAAFIAVYYLFAGLVANFALFANMVIILGVMALFSGTFTLYGIAGIVLTIGMAVDANVLIFERIREELNRKADLPTAVRLGYDKALSAILDANITTLITCIVLFYFATAEIRGFALTLGIGILATLFTALFSTRVFIEIYVRHSKAQTLHMLPTLVPAIERLLSPNINWIGLRRYFFPVSALVIVAGLSLFAVRGEENFDIEFRSGTQVIFDLAEGEQLPIEEARERLRTYGQVAETVHQDIETGERRTDLSDDRQGIYDTLYRVVQESHERREAAQQRGEPVDPPQDFTHLGRAQVVTVGETNRTEEGNLASEFRVATLVTDSRAVGEVIKSAFGDVLDEELARPIRFAAEDIEHVNAAPVYPITAGDLGENIPDRPGLTGQMVQQHVGGVAIVLDQMTPAPTLNELEQRIDRIRAQPTYEDLGFRSFDVIGMEPAETAPGEPQQFTSAVVVSSDPDTNYADTPEAFGDAGGLAATEWSLVRDALQQDTTLGSISNFSGQVSATMQQQAIAAMALALLAVVVYIWFRFGSFRYGAAAIIALVHDVAIALGLLAVAGMMDPDMNILARLLRLEAFQIDLAIVAALLTIVGYSLNDTIVVFDRIRENRGRLARETPAIINDSINQVFSRTVITSSTTLLAVLVLYLAGGPGVHGFAYVVLVGVLVGTYSSIAIAAQALLLFPERKPETVAKKRESHTPTTPATAGQQ